VCSRRQLAHHLSRSGWSALIRGIPINWYRNNRSPGPLGPPLASSSPTATGCPPLPSLKHTTAHRLRPNRRLRQGRLVLRPLPGQPGAMPRPRPPPRSRPAASGEPAPNHRRHRGDPCRIGEPATGCIRHHGSESTARSHTVKTDRTASPARRSSAASRTVSPGWPARPRSGGTRPGSLRHNANTITAAASRGAATQSPATTRASPPAGASRRAEHRTGRPAAEPSRPAPPPARCCAPGSSAPQPPARARLDRHLPLL
jgi:hypothetical protein